MEENMSEGTVYETIQGNRHKRNQGNAIGSDYLHPPEKGRCAQKNKVVVWIMGLLIVALIGAVIALVVLRLYPGKEISSKDEASQVKMAKSCGELHKSGEDRDGVYTITVDGDKVQVYCDMTTDTGGWTVFQRRVNDTISFYRTWETYKSFFGDLSGSHWLGLDTIHQLTCQNDMELYVGLTDFNNTQYYAKYERFYVGGEIFLYYLMVGGYRGTAGDSLSSHNGQSFSTKDRDNDPTTYHCAVSYQGGWWYHKCLHSNLNGPYYSAGQNPGKGMTWFHINNKHENMKSSVMMMREII